MKTALGIAKLSIVVGGVSLLLALTGCDSDGHRDTTPGAKPATSAATTTRAPDQDDKLALQLLNNIIQGEFSTVREHFDATMRDRLSCDKLSAAWTDYQQAFGNYESHGDPNDVVRGDLTVVNVPLHMARMPGEFRVTFHGDGTVAGLFLLRTGVPVP